MQSANLHNRILLSLLILILFFPLIASAKDNHKKANDLIKKGKVFTDNGEVPKAIDAFKKAIALLQTSTNRKESDRKEEAESLDHIAKIYFDGGDFQRSIDYFNQALQVAQSINERKLIGRILNSIGKVYLELGEYQRAIEFYEKALPVQREVTDRVEEAYTLAGFARAYNYLGDTEKSLDYFNQTLVLRRGAQDKKEEGWTLHNIGIVLEGKGDYEKAISNYEQSLEIRKSINDKRGQGNTLHCLGSAFDALDKKKQALGFFNQALDVRRDIGDQKGEAITLYRIARINRDQGNLDNARKQIDTSIKIIEQLRNRTHSRELRTAYFASVQSLYEFYIDLLMQLHQQKPLANYHQLAFEINEKARGRALLDLLTEARSDLRAGADPALVEQEQSLQARLNAKADRLIKLRANFQQRDVAQEVEREIDALTAELQQLEAKIKLSSPRYAALTQPEPLNLKQIQSQVLDGDTLLLEYTIGEQHSYLWLVSNKTFYSYRLPGRAELEPLAVKAYELLTSRNAQQRALGLAVGAPPIAKRDSDFYQVAGQLSSKILGPVAAQLGQKRLLIVADGSLQFLPFGALPLPQVEGYQPLIKFHEVVGLPSATVIAFLRPELKTRQPAPRALFVLADPVFGGEDERLDKSIAKNNVAQNVSIASDSTGSTRILAHEDALKTASLIGVSRDGLMIPRLPGTRSEAQQILALVDRSETGSRFDFDANRAAALSGELSQYRILHFATHGFVDSQRPELSGLLLSMFDKDGKPQDGFLRAHEIFNLNLPAELVVLSACETGLGKAVRGEGLIGLTRGFMYAGAARIVVSLWSVDDKSTSELMVKFYQKMLKEGQRPAAALRAAQLEMLKTEKWQAPYYWAAFQLQGEWN